MRTSPETAEAKAEAKMVIAISAVSLGMDLGTAAALGPINEVTLKQTLMAYPHPGLDGMKVAAIAWLGDHDVTPVPEYLILERLAKVRSGVML